MSGPSDMFGSELEYLWRAVGDAQDASVRSEKERAEAGKLLEDAAARTARLERQLAESAARERRLKAETDRLRKAAEENSKALEEAARRAGEAAGLRASLLKKDGERSLTEAELQELRARVADLSEAVAAREAAIEAFKDKLAGVMALPEIARTLKEDSEASGERVSAYEELLRREARARKSAGEAAARLAEAADREAAAGEALASSERELSAARASLAARAEELSALNARLEEAAKELKISAAEKAGLEGKANALRAALAEKETALRGAVSGSAELRTRLDESVLEAERLRQAVSDASVKAEEQRANFAGAVAQVFDLQKRAAALRTELAEAQERVSALEAALKAKEADLEKVNGLLRDSKGQLVQEKEISRRAALKIKSLEAEIDELKKKLAEASDYTARVLKAVQERDLRIGTDKAALDADRKRIAELEIENEDMRRKNIKFSGMLKREQTDFTTRMLTSLERSAKDVKTFSLRIPAAERKALEPALKNLLASVNLMKGWREYLDPETPDLEETELAPFVSGETAKWERAFKLRKLAISAAVLNPRLRARLSPERIKMLFHDLIKNAYERLQQGGSLRVTLKSSEDGRWAVISFDDTGPGFPTEALEKLYAPFNTTDKGKAGIGLAVCARIAEKHGGKLEVANKPQRGAVVTVTLPLGG